MNASARMGSLLILAMAAVGAQAGCGGDDSKDREPSKGGATPSEDGDDGDGEVVEGGLTLQFSPMYSGWDGVHEYKVPVIVEGIKSATFSASDDTMVDIQKTAEGALITTRKPGTVTITAKAGGLTGTSVLTITKFTPEEWEAGKQRYTMGEPFKLPEFDPCKPPTTLPTISSALSCTNCHGITANFGDVEHTPQQTGGYSDDQLVSIFTMAQKPAGVEMHTRIPEFIWKSFHKWKVDDAQKKGVIAYLRSLTPKAQGTLDFGGIPGRGDGGFTRPTCDGGTPTGGGTSDAGVPLDGG